ncbi:MAG: alcohol dehydrogenase catalytic domain-containing protein [Bacillota bacterium]|nr:alcohol dehydrogenase catalytic domain-containing protein [Bacillota bacterium]
MKTLNNRIMQLTKPYKFEKIEKNVIVNDCDVVVKPTLAYICAADMRYYTGNRRPEALKKKLPMALLHEGIGIVQGDTKGFSKGDKVVIVPNIPGYVVNETSPEECCVACSNKNIGENYCASGKFISSGADGIMQKSVIHPSECVVKIPEGVPDEVAALSELATVSYAASKKVDIKENDTIAIFGNGAVGYILYCVISFVYNIDKDRLFIIGTDESKMEAFEHATKLNIRNDEDADKIANINANYVFECVGGNNMGSAINTAINLIERGGVIISMGVCEENVAINMRDVLEKGLTIKGSSRSSRFEYPIVLEYMKDEKFQQMLRKIIYENAFKIQSVQNLKEAFDFAASKDYWGKILLEFEEDLYE